MKLLVTGGRSGIGEAILKRRLTLGDEVFTTASSQPTLEDLQSKFADTPKLKSCLWDLSQPKQNEKDLDAFLANGIDGLILNAAPASKVLRRFHEIGSEEIQEALQTQVYGNAWLIQKCLPLMVSQNFGRIVFVSSLTVYGTSRYSLYAMAKSAIEGLLRVVATDYGEYNIRANSIRPGIIATERNKRFWSRSDYVGLMTEIIPAKSFGLPEQVAEALDPFLSPNCYINGTHLDVSGGLPNFRSDYLLKARAK